MKKVMCDRCKKEMSLFDCYDEDGYSQYVHIEVMDSRKYSGEYDLCNDCYTNILRYLENEKAMP